MLMLRKSHYLQTGAVFQRAIRLNGLYKIAQYCTFDTSHVYSLGFYGDGRNSLPYTEDALCRVSRSISLLFTFFAGLLFCLDVGIPHQNLGFYGDGRSSLSDTEDALCRTSRSISLRFTFFAGLLFCLDFGIPY
ncbi:hypothetical protein CDAR_118101 [Caerostris darwini]|uniref:Uncharacterized protein n=1 Tax=Caerostris darwini TaxID=1538125 RepID=A0AAV4TEZ7_9ARAC|nr:hypothetical protein CDAR_118101 [Caerostris darwini]